MKQKLIIAFSLLLLLLAIFFMLKDFFFENNENEGNPYEYDLSKYKEVDPDLFCYSLSGKISPEIEKLKGICFDSKDRLYITGKDKVIIYNKSGELVSEFNINGEANCITVSENGEIYLGMSDHIEVWDFSGNQLKQWNKTKDKTLITSVAVSDESLYFADAGNKVVQQCNFNGELIREIGKKNKAKGIPGFFIPSPYFDLLLGRDGELWVVNPGRHQFEAYNSSGELISSWAKTSMQVDGFSGCCNPSHIAILSNGSFVTSEKGIERVKIHLPSGDFQCMVAGPDQFETETKGLDLAVDSHDRIFVMDPKRKNILIFEQKLN